MPDVAVGNSAGARSEPPAILRARAWRTHPDAAHVFYHRPDSDYVIQCWACVLGPTATLLYRHVGTLVTQGGFGVVFSRAELAASLGVGSKLSRNGPFEHALGRLERYGAARWSGEVFEVREALADLSARMLDRAPSSVRCTHELIVGARRNSAGLQPTAVPRHQVPVPRPATMSRHPSPPIDSLVRRT